MSDVERTVPSGVGCLRTGDVVRILQYWNMTEYVPFVRDKNIDGAKIMDVSKETLKEWNPNLNADRFIIFIEDMKRDPKYLNYLKNDNVIKIKETNLCTESQYQTVSVRKISQQESSNFSTVEEILKRITVPKSFLYRNQQKRSEKAVTSYVPMDKTVQKKNFFRLSSYDYPFFDIKSKSPKAESTDRGYYLIKTNSTYDNKNDRSDVKIKCRSMSNADDEIVEDHFYEDLCYNDIKVDKNENQVTHVKPCLVKIQELFQSFKIPFFKKTEVLEDVKEEKKEPVQVSLYENEKISSADVMYDSVHPVNEVSHEGNDSETYKSGAAVEEYLEPMNVDRDYCDVILKQKEESLLSYILSYFEARFGRRETNEPAQSEESEVETAGDVEGTKWDRKTANMAARPLPVPVENESYYMNVDRAEAENLLLGHPDGTFILRPSSQPNHAYTLSVSCANSVHNVGIRRRPDGRLALGFARRGERSFTSVTALLQHHKKRRLLLVAAGELIGATTLNDTPQYYQTPKNIPVTPRT